MSRNDVYGAMCATKAGRENLARQLNELATRAGWSVETESLDPREISVTMARGAYHVTVHLTGGSKVGAFLGHWFMRYASDAPHYPAGFAGAAPNSSQGLASRPHHKATACADNWRPFLRQLEAGMADWNAALDSHPVQHLTPDELRLRMYVKHGVYPA
jgi:hypothetical protein